MTCLHCEGWGCRRCRDARNELRAARARALEQAARITETTVCEDRYTTRRHAAERIRALAREDR